jgi:hypothetical protein
MFQLYKLFLISITFQTNTVIKHVLYKVQYIYVNKKTNITSLINILNLIKFYYIYLIYTLITSVNKYFISNIILIILVLCLYVFT